MIILDMYAWFYLLDARFDIHYEEFRNMIYTQFNKHSKEICSNDAHKYVYSSRVRSFCFLIALFTDAKLIKKMK